MQILVTAVCTCASPSISTFCAADPRRAQRGPFRPGSLFPSNTDFSLQERELFFFFYIPPPSKCPSLALAVARLQSCKSMHHFSPALLMISTKAAAMEQPLRLFAGLNFTDVRLLSFPPSERCAAGMDLQDKCSCVCERESSGTTRPFQSADGMEKSQHYAHVKSIKNKSLHAENTEFLESVAAQVWSHLEDWKAICCCSRES